jgi:hypothetical protein
MKGLIKIKIDIVKSQVVFTPESDEEKAKLTAIWNIMVDCVRGTRKLVPVGEYVPQKNDKGASFYIEGLQEDGSSFVEVKVDHDTRVFCMTCNKFLDVKAGSVIPLCCGKMMTIAD